MIEPFRLEFSQVGNENGVPFTLALLSKGNTSFKCSSLSGSLFGEGDKK